MTSARPADRGGHTSGRVLRGLEAGDAQDVDGSRIGRQVHRGGVDSLERGEIGDGRGRLEGHRTALRHARARRTGGGQHPSTMSSGQDSPQPYPNTRDPTGVSTTTTRRMAASAIEARRDRATNAAARTITLRPMVESSSVLATELALRDGCRRDTRAEQPEVFHIVLNL